VNVTVTCAGQLVRAGDVVIADDDGVCVVPRSRAAATLAACQAREAREAGVRELLRAGRLGVDHYTLRPLLERLGVRYVDQAADLESG
jgi:4-hydroxy-4-methyl-2-oxoglutarate aldolase